MDREKLNQIMDLVDERLLPAGFECIEAEWVSHEATLRLYVDREAGIDVAGCVEATRLLDDWDILGGKETGRYTLEVSSPGIERPLRRLRHFAKWTESEIFIQLTEKVDERRKGVGRLSQVSDDGRLVVVLECGEWVIPHAAMAKAHVVYHWDS